MINEYIIISGGTSEIGKEIIYKLIKKTNIIFTYNKSFHVANNIIKNIKKDLKCYKIIPIKLDLFNFKDINNFSSLIRKNKFLIKAFVHNACINSKRAAFLDLKFSQFQKTITGNCLGSFLLTQVIARAMQRNSNELDKTITFISSQSAEYGGIELTPYSSSKGFINTFSNALSKEFASHGIRSNVVSLGKFKTFQLTSNLRSRQKKINATDIPLGHLGRPSYVAEIINYLIYNSPYLSGANIKLSGGR
jgi:NAD(P)-dependent dehydrogenase (short-subunit alcohol dehydrogenase family)